MKRNVRWRKVIPYSLLIILLTGGVFVSLPYIAFLNNFFSRLLREPPQLVSPFIEEPLKMVPIIFAVVISRKRVLKCQWIVCGMIVGLAFAIPEAYGYVVKLGANPEIRALVAFGHVAWAGITSIGFINVPNISLKRGSSSTRFKRALGSLASLNFLPFLVTAITLHFVWNARIGGLPIASQFLYITLCYAILFYLAKLSSKK